MGRRLTSTSIVKIVKRARPKEVQLRTERLSMNVKESFALFVFELTTRITSMTLLGTRTGTAIIAQAIASALAAKDRTLQLS